MLERDTDDLPISHLGVWQVGEEKKVVAQVEEFVSPSILEETERAIFQTAPYLDEPGTKEHWTDFLYYLDHQLLPDEAPTFNQRWLAVQCALALSGKVNVALNLRESGYSQPFRPFDPHDQLNTQVATAQDVVTYYGWYKQGESEDFGLQHVFAASKRILLASHYKYREDPSYSRRDQYQSHLASYYLLEQAVKLDASSPPLS